MNPRFKTARSIAAITLGVCLVSAPALAGIADSPLPVLEAGKTHQRAKPARRNAARSKSRQHPAFGLWASRPEAADPVAFVDQLRHHIMERRKRVRKAR
jgi:hypothetical protein